MRRRRPDPAGAGPRQPAQQRGEVHRPPAAASRSRAAARGRRGRRRGRATTASASPPSMLPRVFDLFAQVRRARSTAPRAASGIGLTLVSSLVELHGGTSRRDSDGPGPRQRVRRPAAAAAAPRRRADAAADGRRRGAGAVAGASWSSTTTSTPPSALRRLLELHAATRSRSRTTALAALEVAGALGAGGRPARHRPAAAWTATRSPAASARGRRRAALAAGRGHRLRPGGGPPPQRARPASTTTWSSRSISPRWRR